ncbi:plasmid replication protein RepC [Coralliovum pocilloporae]|uniref:plasmid replication protein RepC n=1 Tax=Coralliovum pocilloporae TaxID=3066369 RepID=UPI003307820F
MTDIAVSAPFGAAGLTARALKGQALAGSCPDSARADKWQILRDLTDTRHDYGLSDRAVAVLSALLSFYPDDELAGDGNLIVFPSNQSLCSRAHGISEPTLRRHLTSLVQSGLLVRRDSPNGKRYARRDGDGEITKAFGFDLSALLAHASQLREKAKVMRQERRLCQDLREQITLLRRDVCKTIEFAIEEALPGPWAQLLEDYARLAAPLKRRASLEELQAAYQAIFSLNETVHKNLKLKINFKNMNGNAANSERHKQDSKPIPYSDSEKSSPDWNEDASPDDNKDPQHSDEAPYSRSQEKTDDGGIKSPSPEARSTLRGESPGSSPSNKWMDMKLHLKTVLDACPQLQACQPDPIISWAGLVEAADRACLALGISESAWTEARNRMGVYAAAVTIATIVQRADVIQSPGGYLRALTAKDGFTPLAAIEALMRKKVKPDV